MPRVPIRRLALDWTAPLGILVVGVVDVALHPRSATFPGSPAVHLAFLTAGVAALGYRRRAPAVLPLLAIAIVTVWSAGMWPTDAQGPFEGFLVMVAAGYAIAAGNTGRRLTRATAALAAMFAVQQAILMSVGGSVGDLVPLVVWIGAAWGVGLVLTRRSAQAREASDRAATIAVEHERRMAEAVVDERSRIARELHDVVAHSLSVVVVQAAAERRALRAGTSDPSATDAVLESVERAGREALVELRRLLGLLRHADAAAPTLAPQPSLGQLDALVDHVRATGLVVDVTTTGDPAPLPAGVDLSAYRIVQEALTNVVKHARATTATVRVEYARASVAVEVVDDGAGCDVSSQGSGGHGLIGMRERATLYGGTLNTGPREGGRGFAVRARLPIESPVAEPAWR